MQMYLDTETGKMVSIVPKSKISAKVEGHGKVDACRIRTIYDSPYDNGIFVNFKRLKPLSKKEEKAMVKEIIKAWTN